MHVLRKREPFISSARNFNGFSNYEKPNKIVSNSGTIILLVMILYTPVAVFDFFYIIIAFITFVIAITKKRIVIDNGLPRIFFLYFVALIFYSLIKSLGFENTYDLKELSKLAIFVMIFSTTRFIDLELLQKIFLSYVVFDFALSFAEFTQVTNFLTVFISNLYHAGNHASFAENWSSVRSLGLSPGPGQHGGLSLLFFIFFVTFYLFDKKTKVSFSGALLSLISLFLSQSKTAILCFFIFVTLTTLIFIFSNRGSSTIKAILFAITCFILGITIIDWALSTFYELQRLSASGLEISSFTHRLSLWRMQISESLQAHPFLVLFGPGRGYLDFKSIYHNSFDSDYVYMFTQYGIAGSIIMSSVMMWFLIRNILNFRSISTLKKSILMIMIIGVICGLALDFFSDIKILAIIAFLLATSRYHISRIKQSSLCSTS